MRYSHCRWCGRVICSRCSGNRINWKPGGSRQRVCDMCYAFFVVFPETVHFVALQLFVCFLSLISIAGNAFGSLLSFLTNTSKHTLFCLLLFHLRNFNSFARIELIQNVSRDLLQHLLRECAQHTPGLIQ